MTYLNFTRPTKVDYIIFFIYTIISILIYMMIQKADPNSYFKGFSLIMIYCMLTQVIMLHALYKHLRNTTNVLFWFMIGVFHLYLAFTLKDEYKLTEKELAGIGFLINTIFLVILLQIMRIISLMATQQEFIVPLKFLHLFDLIDQRKSTATDVLLIFLYWGAFIGLPYFWLALEDVFK